MDIDTALRQAEAIILNKQVIDMSIENTEPSKGFDFSGINIIVDKTNSIPDGCFGLQNGMDFSLYRMSDGKKLF